MPQKMVAFLLLKDFSAVLSHTYLRNIVHILHHTYRMTQKILPFDDVQCQPGIKALKIEA